MEREIKSQSEALTDVQSDLRSFLVALSGQIHLTAIHPDNTDIVACDFGTDLDAASDWAFARNGEGYNIHYTVNSVRDGISRKPKKSEIVGVRFAHVDIDPPKDGGTWDQGEQMLRLMHASPQPSMIVCSGNGVQALWRIDEATVAQAEEINIGLIACFGGDKGTHNADRLLRVPGTINYPDSKKRAAGRTPAIAFTPIGGEDDGTISSVEDLLAAYGDDDDPFSSTLTSIQSGPLGEIDCSLSFDLGLEPGDALYKLIDEPIGTDRSIDTYACACEMGRRGYSREEIAGVLLYPGNAVSDHCLDQKDPKRAAFRAIDKAFSERDVIRRQAQRLADRQIGEGSDIVPMTEIFALKDMLQRFVFIHEGSQVADLLRPQAVLQLPDFKNATAGSRHSITKADGGKKLVPCSQAWLGDHERKDAEALTYQAGAQRIAVSPKGKRALNLWSPISRDTPPSDWQILAALFVEHIQWLWGEHADVLLDWLAHIEQKPGELPHIGWIHISRIHGMGRNWISAVLARLWRGNVAASLDLMGVLESGFNDRLSRCQLAIVDEIHEGGNQVYRHAQMLRKIVTEEFREINPKYGRRHVEYNSTRWLIFSNHTGAIPLGEEDRRFYVVSKDGPVREPGYYDRLYGALKDPFFISSVSEFLRQRDISTFNPGMRAPLTKAKVDLIEFSLSEVDTTLKDLVANWPVDVIKSTELKDRLGVGALTGRPILCSMDRAEIRKLKKLRFVRETSQRVYSLRNHERWADGSPDELRAEINRESSAHKIAALDQDDDGFVDTL